MAKESGLGWTTMTIEDSGGGVRDIKNDITNMDFATPRASQDTTGLDKSAMERLQMVADYSATYNGVFNDAANQSHDVFKSIPNSSVQRQIIHVVSGQTLTIGSGLGSGAFLNDYPLTRANDGAFTWAVPASLADGTAPAWT